MTHCTPVILRSGSDSQGYEQQNQGPQPGLVSNGLDRVGPEVGGKPEHDQAHERQQGEGENDWLQNLVSHWLSIFTRANGSCVSPMQKHARFLARDALYVRRSLGMTFIF